MWWWEEEGGEESVVKMTVLRDDYDGGDCDGFGRKVGVGEGKIR